MRKEDLRACVVFGRRLPVWLFALEALGFWAHTVVLEDSALASWIDSVFAPAGGVVCASAVPRVPGPVVVFCDGRVTEFVLEACSSCEVVCVVSTKGLRLRAGQQGIPRGFTHRSVVSHAAVGGVTDSQVTACVHWWQPLMALDFPTVPTRAPRDASTIIGSTVHCNRLVPGPVDVVDPVAVVNVGTKTTPVYRSDGLLPASFDLTTLILAPHCFTPGRWGRRTLTHKEALEALDVPARFLAPLQTL